MQDNTDKLRSIALGQVPRILGLGDRLKTSKTYGCFDRYYWHYKLVDFSCGWFQNACYLLALLYTHNFKDNIYYENKNILEWMRASINYALQCMNSDGSLDEMYPFERSFCVTSFFLYYASEALIICKEPVQDELFKMADWLAKNNNKELSNQTTAAAMGLHNIFLLTQQDKYRISAEEKIGQLIKAQSQYGIFPEYAGLDIGYLSITLGILSKYHQKTNDGRIYSSCKESLAVIDKKVDEFGAYNYEENARKTQYLYPYGFLYFKHDIFNRILQGIEKDRIINPSWMDDKYVIPLTIDYLEAYLGANK